jgi:cytochrome c5
MKWRWGKTGLWLGVTFATAAVAFGAGQGQTEKGEQILSQACLSCHDLRPIQVQALDEDGWTKIVNSMIQKGAEVKKEDIPAFVEYLVRKHGPLPDGAGKAIVLNICTMCHDLDRIVMHGATREEWEDILLSMLNEGAPLSDDQLPVVLNYLTRNFRPQ